MSLYSVKSYKQNLYEKFFASNVVQNCKTAAKKTKKLIQVVL